MEDMRSFVLQSARKRCFNNHTLKQKNNWKIIWIRRFAIITEILNEAKKAQDKRLVLFQDYN